MYVFGYGSLLWYTNFEYDAVVPGILKGFVRRFYQLSPDHRGTENNPGRAVTLVPEAEGICWGVSYHVPKELEEETIAYLDHRERAGYRSEWVDFQPDDKSASFKVLVYICIPNNNPYLSIEPCVNKICDQIISAHGCSGSNLEYAIRLVHCVKKMAPHVKDDHLSEIEQELLSRCKKFLIRDKVLIDVGYQLDYMSVLAQKA
uniref:Gamma-glutamylcyclotransferase n=1 Tax=Rhabditophanes sp. KR3021 TaxID=114890 RepID=A0AC35UFU5_9BILA